MASIQQSLNQLLGATAGAATMGSYMIRGSDWYKAGQLEKRANKLMKYELAQTGEKTGEAYEEARKLEVEAAKLHPTKERVDRASVIWGERDEEAEPITKSKLAKEDPNKRVPLPFATDTGAPEGTLQDVIEASNAPAEPLSLHQQARKKAEAEAFSRLKNQTATLRNQTEARKDRFDMLRAVLSAKERSQLDTMYNRHKNKGELD